MHGKPASLGRGACGRRRDSGPLWPQNRCNGGAYSAAKGGRVRKSGLVVNAYTILIHDRRWRRPLVLDAEMARDARACEYAREQLASSSHYAAVEVWRGAVKLCHVVNAPTDIRAAA
jgi:hypothetical protein